VSLVHLQLTAAAALPGPRCETQNTSPPPPLKGPCGSDRVALRPDQAVDLIVGHVLGVRGVAVFGQSLAGVPVAGQTFLIQMHVDSRVQLYKKIFFLKGLRSLQD